MLHLERRALPARAAIDQTGLYFALRDITPNDLQDPFMQQTIQRIRGTETYYHVARAEMHRPLAGAAPAGIIFHVGRCGSTMLSQGLKQHGGVVVYSEPLPINDTLAPPHKWPREDLVAALRNLAELFSAHASGPYVLKLSSWSTLFADVVLEAFPHAPWVFCVRDPVEVCEAIRRDPPPWFMGDTEVARHLSQMVDPRAEARSPEEFSARLYAALCDAVGALELRNGALVSYEALRDALTDLVPKRFGLDVNGAQRQRMIESASSYAKAPLSMSAPFASDAASKQASATALLREAVDAFARPALERLHQRLAAGI